MRIVSFFSFLIFLGFQSYAQSSNVQDLNSFDEAYSQYWSKPVENWEKIASTKQTEVYTVQRKDTLSELSQVFFGTPYYWPKIWSLNAYIGNPHLIYPGNRIGFYLGSVEGPAPQIFLGAQGPKVPESSIYALDNPEILIPPEPVEKPVLSKIPKSFPEWQMAAGNDGFIGTDDVERQFSKLDNNIMTFDLTSFLHQGEIKSYGEIKGFLNVDVLTASSFDEVYIQRYEPLPIGSVYTLVIPRKNVKSPKGSKIKDVYIYEYIGEVQITEDNKNNSGLVAGRITRALDMIDRGALLIEGKVPQYDLRYNPEEIKSIDAKILRGSDIFGHNILGVGQTVFLSQGEKDGLMPGTLIQIKQNREERNPEQELLNIVNKIGVIKIVLSEPDVSTGIVVSSRDFMIPGDKTIK